MYARTTTLIADPTRIDDGIADVRDNVMPSVLEMDGCTGLSMLCDRGSGRCIVTTAWQTDQAMAASRDRVMSLRRHAADAFGARAPEVQEWEIAAMHRLHTPGDDACARVTWTRMADTAAVDRTIEAFRHEVLPRLDDVPGFCSLSLLVDRGTGLSSMTAVYADRQALDASTTRTRAMREEFTDRMHLEIIDLADFDVALHHLRVPELV